MCLGIGKGIRRNKYAVPSASHQSCQILSAVIRGKDDDDIRMRSACVSGRTEVDQTKMWCLSVVLLDFATTATRRSSSPERDPDLPPLTFAPSPAGSGKGYATISHMCYDALGPVGLPCDDSCPQLSYIRSHSLVSTAQLYEAMVGGTDALSYALYTW